MNATEKRSAEVDLHDKWEPFKWSKFLSKYFELIMGILCFAMFATTFTLLGFIIGISSQPRCEAKHLSTEMILLDTSVLSELAKSAPATA